MDLLMLTKYPVINKERWHYKCRNGNLRVRIYVAKVYYMYKYDQAY